MITIGKFIGGILLTLAGWFGVHQAQAPSQPALGSASFNPIQTQVFFLAGSGITANATTVLLSSMNYGNGTPVTMADLGNIGYATIEPGASREEQVSFTGISQNNNGTAQLTGVTRGLAFNPGTQGCAGSSTLSTAHAGASQFVLSNTACFYQQFAILGNTSTITGAWAFSSTVPTSNLSNASDSANPQNLVTQANLASTSFAGVVNGSVSQKGIFQEATRNQLAAASGTGSTGADLVITPLLTASTSQATTSIVVTNASGTIDSSFISSSITYSVGGLISASTTLNGTTTLTNVTSSLLQTNSSGNVFAAGNGATTGSLLYYYNSAWQSKIQKSFFSLTATIPTSTNFIAGASTTLPLASIGDEIYNFSFNVINNDGGFVNSSTLYIQSGNASTTLATCGIQGNASLQGTGVIYLENSTSSEVYSLSLGTTNCNSPSIGSLEGTLSLNFSTTTYLVYAVKNPNFGGGAQPSILTVSSSIYMIR